MEFSSKLLENAVNEMSQLPGIGKRTALRLVLHLLRQDASQTTDLAAALVHLKTEIKYCSNCFGISDTAQCHICANSKRDQSLLCVVEDIRDIMAIENTSQYNGLYFVLGGKISPMEGIGPGDLNIAPLVEKLREGVVKEVIFAMSASMEGDTTNFFIFKKLKEFNVAISTLSRGVAIGSELQYADEITLSRSLLNRQPFEV